MTKEEIYLSASKINTLPEEGIEGGLYLNNNGDVFKCEKGRYFPLYFKEDFKPFSPVQHYRENDKVQLDNVCYKCVVDYCFGEFDLKHWLEVATAN